MAGESSDFLPIANHQLFTKTDLRANSRTSVDKTMQLVFRENILPVSANGKRIMYYTGLTRKIM